MWEGKKGRGNGKAEKVGEKKEGIKGGGGKEKGKRLRRRKGKGQVVSGREIAPTVISEVGACV